MTGIIENNVEMKMIWKTEKRTASHLTMASLQEKIVKENSANAMAREMRSPVGAPMAGGAMTDLPSVALRSAHNQKLPRG
jgi:hypothetical protein